MEYDCEGKLNSRKRYDVHRICPLSMLLDGKFRKAMHPNRSHGAKSFNSHFISLARPGCNQVFEVDESRARSAVSFHLSASDNTSLHFAKESRIKTLSALSGQASSTVAYKSLSLSGSVSGSGSQSDLGFLSEWPQFKADTDSDTDADTEII